MADSSWSPPAMHRAASWTTTHMKDRFRRLQRMVSSPKRLHADELDFGELPRPERANSIMHLWRFRGAYRPITAFYKFECKLGEGAFGSVSKWRIKNAAQAVAVKQRLSLPLRMILGPRIKWRAIWPPGW